MEHWWNHATGKTKSILGKPVPMSLCPPKIPHELAWDRHHTSIVRSHWQTTWTVVWLLGFRTAELCTGHI